MRGTIVVDTERCKGCNLCVVACPLKIIRLSQRQVNRKGYPFAEQLAPGMCTGCTSCAIVCPDGCISVYRTR
ncbi:MAG: 4Fe-4S binding protein [Bacteroidaceae bacterium]|nr:4Fe-4S binding protein [Bacteroidaceae bacterium]